MILNTNKGLQQSQAYMGDASGAPVDGMGILRNAANENIGRMETQGAQAVQGIERSISAPALAGQQRLAGQSITRNMKSANNLHDSAMEQYGVELTPAQQKAIERRRQMKSNAAAAAAANGVADDFFARKAAAVADAAGVGDAIEQRALGGLAQSESVRQGIELTNRGLKDQQRSGFMSLVGTGLGFALGGPTGAMVGASAGNQFGGIF